MINYKSGEESVRRFFSRSLFKNYTRNARIFPAPRSVCPDGKIHSPETAYCGTHGTGRPLPQVRILSPEYNIPSLGSDIVPVERYVPQKKFRGKPSNNVRNRFPAYRYDHRSKAVLPRRKERIPASRFRNSNNSNYTPKLFPQFLFQATPDRPLPRLPSVHSFRRIPVYDNRRSRRSFLCS